MDIYDVSHWAGTEQSLAAYLEALKRMDTEGVHAKADVYSAAQAAREAPRLYSKQGDIGVVSISGSLNNSSSWMNEYMGSTGYPEIRDALVYAAQQEGVKTIVLDIKSGGGAVSGVSDTAELIKTIDTRVKPVVAYSDGLIASAAYWLGSSARSLHIGPVTEAGSIGVLVVHMEKSKMAEDMGITVNVIRSGKYKALGNSMEPLSDLGKEVLQAQVDRMNEMFTADIAANRGTTAALVNQNMGQGRVFIGQDAVDVGLVDGVTSFDAFMSKTQGGIDSQKQQPKYGANSPKGLQLKTALTDQQIAALAAGAVAAGDVAALTPEQVAAAAAEAAAAEVAAAEAAAAAAAAAKPAPKVDPVVDLLQGQLAAAQAQVLALSMEVKEAKDAGTVALASADKMRPIVRAAVSNLRIALGGAAAGVELLDDAGLMAEHANLAAQFTTKFKAGGVAAVSSTPSADQSAAIKDEAARLARVQAVRRKSNAK